MNEYEKEKYLDKRLAAYALNDYYPFHMPGHKRRALSFGNPYKIDITEIEGFDDLHHPESILKESQERLRALYQSKKAYYLVNGSTCGILSGIGALVKPGDRILIARNCHKSVYNAAKIFQLKINYVYPRFLNCGIQGKIDPEDVEGMVKKYPDIKLVVITSPTYEGIVSDVQKLAELSREYHFYLLVDEAHGAHFSLSDHFPQSAIHQKADIVIQSLHKTLPSFTQTAVLHIASDRIESNRIEEMLGIFQTSSPSYLLMAGMERCVRLLEQSGKQLFEQYDRMLEYFYERCKQLKCLCVLAKEWYEPDKIYDVDHSKIVISTLHTSINGFKLYQTLLQKYHIQLEMYSAQYVLAMTSIMDTQEGFERLYSALSEIDRRLIMETGMDIQIQDRRKYRKKGLPEFFLQQVYAVREKAMEMWDALNYVRENQVEECACTDSIGRICAECIYLYPPGIPMILPGEIISKEFIEILDQCREAELNVMGTKDIKYQKILTIAQ